MPIFKRAQAGVALDVAGVAVGDTFKAPAILENLPSNTKRTDEIEAAQLPGWRQGVEQLDNRTTSVYLRALVLTGARREELAALTWANVDFQWRMLTVADKVGQARTNPLTPYLEQIEAHILERASIVFDAAMEPGKLHMVAGKIKFSATEKYKTLYTFAMKTVEFRGASLDDLRSFPQTANRKPQCAMPDINSTRCKTGWPLMMPSPCQLSVLV